MLKFIFEDPNIIKIFHSCESDVKLLKSDFDFNIVNLFDTAKAQKLITKNK